MPHLKGKNKPKETVPNKDQMAVLLRERFYEKSCWGCGSVVEVLPYMDKALGLIPSRRGRGEKDIINNSFKDVQRTEGKHVGS